jgi:hypothetical protein
MRRLSSLAGARGDPPGTVNLKFAWTRIGRITRRRLNGGAGMQLALKRYDPEISSTSWTSG